MLTEICDNINSPDAVLALPAVAASASAAAARHRRTAARAGSFQLSEGRKVRGLLCRKSFDGKGLKLFLSSFKPTKQDARPGTILPFFRCSCQKHCSQHLILVPHCRPPALHALYASMCNFWIVACMSTGQTESQAYLH